MEKGRLGVCILPDKKTIRLPDSVLKKLNLNLGDLIIFYNDGKDDNKIFITKGEVK